MLETSARLLQLLGLLQAQRDWRGDRLAGELGVTLRTVRRDIERLRRLGYRIDASTGPEGGYRLGAGAIMPPLLLNDEEAVAIAVGLRTAVGVGVAAFDEVSVRALTKLEQLLPDAARRRVRAMSEATTPGQTGGPSVTAETLLTIATAIRDRETLRFAYGTRTASGPRHVEPCGLVPIGRRWYLVAWDLEREDWRTFRVDRMSEKVSPHQNFSARPAPSPDLPAYVRTGLSGGRDAVQADILLHVPAGQATLFAPWSSGRIEPVDDHHCRLRAGADWLDGLLAFVALTGAEFEVISPPGTAARLAALSGRFARAAERTEARAHSPAPSE